MGIVIKILLISYIYIVSNGLVNRQIADYSLNSSKWPLLLHALILCRRNSIAWVFSVFIFFSFGLVYLVNKKPYQDRYKNFVYICIYTDHGEQNWKSSANSLLIWMNSMKCVYGTFFYIEIWIEIIVLIWRQSYSIFCRIK